MELSMIGQFLLTWLMSLKGTFMMTAAEVLFHGLLLPNFG
jgi:hypothetical protein